MPLPSIGRVVAIVNWRPEPCLAEPVGEFLSKQGQAAVGAAGAAAYGDRAAAYDEEALELDELEDEDAVPEAADPDQCAKLRHSCVLHLGSGQQQPAAGAL